MKNLLQFDELGIYCPRADVYIDPWKGVKRAIITHAHSDHARWGSDFYLCHHDTKPMLYHRLGKTIEVESKAYNEAFYINGVKFSLHPAGHIIGSAQVCVEYKGEVWVVSGDYKTTSDNISTPFEAIKCQNFITESTFGLPVYKWPTQKEVFKQINQWWRSNKALGKTSVLFGYSLGKAQRLLQNVDTGIGKIYTHGAVENTNEVLRNAGIPIVPTEKITSEHSKKELNGNLVVAPPSAYGTPWMKRMEPYSTAVASGWMALRGPRRRRNVDRGFVLSDHADWPGLLEAVEATEAQRIFVTHGYRTTFSKYLQELGYEAGIVETEYEGELSEIGESKVEEDANYKAAS